MKHSRRHTDKSLIAGIILLVIGFVLMLQNFNVLYIGSVWSYWMFIPVIIGIVKITNAESKKEYGEGVWMIFLGLWLFVSIKHIYGLGFGETWPALLIAWGVSVIWKSFGNHSYNLAKE